MGLIELNLHVRIAGETTKNVTISVPVRVVWPVPRNAFT